MGFVSRRARYNLGIPLLVLTAVYVFWAGYSYLLEKVLHIP
jgi:hypothetical protein